MAYVGFNFRASSGYVTDTTGYSAVHDVDSVDYTYPKADFSNGVTAGYDGGSGTMRPRDRSSSVDARLAGKHFSNTATTINKWKIAITAGTKNVALAVGDAVYAVDDDYIELFDDTASLGVLVDDSSGHPGGQFYDAAGTLHTSAANWVSNQAPVSKTFASGFMIFSIGRGAGSAGGQCITHVAYEDAGGGGGGATRGMPFGHGGTAFNGGRVFQGVLR